MYTYKSYRAALDAVSSNADSESSAMRRNLCSNISMVLLKTGDARGALVAADGAVLEDPTWVKVRFREWHW